MTKIKRIKLKRAYDEPSDKDGSRILVDRIWPRGISKDNIQIDDWLKDIAPSTKLRKWFGHDPEKWNEFKKRYFQELTNKQEIVDTIRNRMKNRHVTLVYSAKEQEFNNATALKEYIENHSNK